MIVVDTSILFALLHRQDDRHRAAVDWYEDSLPHLATTPLVLAELDHLANARLGRQGAAAVRADIVAGAYDVDWWRSAHTDATAVAQRYAELDVGLTDASLVALAARLETTRIATFDERHFRAMTPLAGGEAFTVLPADA